METRFHWSRGNAKLRKTQSALRARGERASLISFGLPAFASSNGRRVCPGAGRCADYCYARQGRYLMPAVSAARKHNLGAALEAGPSLAVGLLEDLRKTRSITHVRLHDSGDFFSAAYLDAWRVAAADRPDIVFYGYSKSIPLLANAELPPNLRIVQSLGGVWDHLVDRTRPHSRVFADDAELRSVGYSDGSATDLLAIDRELRIGLVYHGTRKLHRGLLEGDDRAGQPHEVAA